ncbi:Glutathione S-transferase tau 7 [Hibiscus syriacus]|uniref:Glutathione S-transferase tau 7 n=1 Tax=Hibiscus syriacus TaxID=106335 RepID=A0A6A2YDP0_HIBSY|nr:Glutathione S-transferase tau 7 [Hibiscus syriacus]
MPPLNLAKKLKPARKAWRSFTIKVKSKLETLDVLNSIYIDQLLQSKHKEPPQEAETSRRIGEEVEESSGVYSIEDARKAVIAKSPHLRGVDERADEFIYKFREERKLEKERSDLDFQEMLARSA